MRWCSSVDSAGPGIRHCAGNVEAGSIYDPVDLGWTWLPVDVYMFSGITSYVCSVETVVFHRRRNKYIYFKNGSRPSNQTTKNKTETKRKITVARVALREPPGQVVDLSILVGSGSIELQFATNTVWEIKAKKGK